MTVPRSTISPRSIAQISSAAVTVQRRWAMTMTVRPGSERRARPEYRLPDRDRRSRWSSSRNENGSVLQKGPGNSEPLPFAAGKAGVLRIQGRVVTFGLAGDEIVGTGGACRRLHVSIGRVRAPQANIVGDRALEQNDILQDHGDGAVERLAVECAHIDSRRSEWRRNPRPERRATKWASVDLPAPDGPTRAIICPGLMWPVIACSATPSVSP